MMKSINISTKITLLILLVSLVAVSAIGFFTYDFLLKANQEKNVTNLSVIAENKAGYLNSYFDKIVIGIKTIQSSDVIKNGAAATTAATVDPLMALMGGGGDEESTPAEETSSDPLKDFLIKQKEIYGFEHLLITSNTGTIVSSSEGKTGAFLDEDGLMFHEGQKGIYFSMVGHDTTGYKSFVVAPVEMTSGPHLLIAKINL